MTAYAHPEMLVETNWVKENLNKPNVKLVEVDVDTTAYDAGHIPGAIGFNWEKQLQNQVTRDIISKESFEQLVGQAGITPDDIVVIYGDNNNWFAAYALWLFKIYNHNNVQLMNGGRQKWLNEDDKELTTARPQLKPSAYKVNKVNRVLRAFVTDVFTASKSTSYNFVDVRSNDEYTGKVIAPPGMNETAQRGGHIPGAKNIPWSTAVNEDGTFKSADELQSIYFDQKGVDPNKESIAYCRIGERSSHTWFVLKYLLGIDKVKNYDGSWTEYGNLVGAPIER